MFLPNNTNITRVISVTADGDELMVERHVKTEMVYWDMVTHIAGYIVIEYIFRQRCLTW